MFPNPRGAPPFYQLRHHLFPLSPPMTPPPRPVRTSSFLHQLIRSGKILVPCAPTSTERQNVGWTKSETFQRNVTAKNRRRNVATTSNISVTFTITATITRTTTIFVTIAKTITATNATISTAAAATTTTTMTTSTTPST